MVVYQFGQYTVRCCMLVKYVRRRTSCPLMGLMKFCDPLSKLVAYTFQDKHNEEELDISARSNRTIPP